MRLEQLAALVYGRDHSRKLNGSNRNRSLADSHRNRFTRVPLMVVDTLDPFFRRNKTWLLARQVDAGAPAQAQAGGILVNPIDPKTLTDGIEKHVTRIHDGLVKIDGAMSRRPPAVEDSPVKIGVSRTRGSEVFRKRLGLKHRSGHYDLEDRPWCKLPLNGTIQ